MSLGQDILAAVNGIRDSVTTLGGTVDRIIEAVENLVVNGTISPEVAAEILGTAAADKAAVDANTAELEAEITRLSGAAATPTPDAAAAKLGNPGD